jgi:PhnB protein
MDCTHRFAGARSRAQGPLAAADTPDPEDYTPGNDITMSLIGEDEVLPRAYFERLAAGGSIIIPLKTAPWA